MGVDTIYWGCILYIVGVDTIWCGLILYIVGVAIVHCGCGYHILWVCTVQCGWGYHMLWVVTAHCGCGYCILWVYCWCGYNVFSSTFKSLSKGGICVSVITWSLGLHFIGFHCSLIRMRPEVLIDWLTGWFNDWLIYHTDAAPFSSGGEWERWDFCERWPLPVSFRLGGTLYQDHGKEDDECPIWWVTRVTVSLVCGKESGEGVGAEMISAC